MEVIHGNPVRRATIDIDVAILLSDWHQYDEIMNELVKFEGFKKAREKHRLIYTNNKDQVIVDIIPFGDISRPDDEITWPPEYEIVMTTFGFSEVYKNTIEVKFSDSISIKIASLEGLAILKIAAWSDRKREKDAVDLKIILNSYFDINSDDIYENHPSLIQEPDFDYLKCGARALGRNIEKIIKNNTKLKNKITALLQEEIADIDNSKLSLAMLKVFPIETNNEYKYNYELLTELLKGIQD